MKLAVINARNSRSEIYEATQEEKHNHGKDLYQHFGYVTAAADD